MDLKKNIFLDLDNTLICSEDYSRTVVKDAYVYDYDFLYPFVTTGRPYLQFFLDYLFENFNVSIWTAASKNYASFIYDRFIKRYNHKRQIKLLLYNVHCELSMKKTGGSKSLSMLWEVWKFPGFDKNNTFIIDDLKEVFTIQPQNCIRIKPFIFNKNGMIYDDELIKLIYKLEQIKEQK